MATKKDKEMEKLKDQFDEIQGDGTGFDFSNHLAQLEDLPSLGELEIYDYDADTISSTKIASEVLETLVDLYLGDIPTLKEHPYIKNKMNEDAGVYAEALFLAKMTRKNLLTQLQLTDSGETSARSFEVLNQTIKEVRENSKFLSSQRTELEKYWKDLRNDLGYEEINTYKNETIVQEVKSEDEDDKGAIIDQRSLNDMIKNAMLKKDENKK